MDARRAVKAAKAVKNSEAEAAAHGLVDQAKRGLGERGPVWWKDDKPDFNRHAAKNSIRRLVRRAQAASLRDSQMTSVANAVPGCQPQAS